MLRRAPRAPEVRSVTPLAHLRRSPPGDLPRPGGPSAGARTERADESARARWINGSTGARTGMCLRPVRLPVRPPALVPGLARRGRAASGTSGRHAHAPGAHPRAPAPSPACRGGQQGPFRRAVRGVRAVRRLSPSHTGPSEKRGEGHAPAPRRSVYGPTGIANRPRLVHAPPKRVTRFAAVWAVEEWRRTLGGKGLER